MNESLLIPQIQARYDLFYDDSLILFVARTNDRCL